MHRIPFPPDKGDKIRSFREMDALAEEADVTLACFVDDPADRAHLGELERWCTEVVALPLARLRSRVRGLGAVLGRSSLSLAAYRSAAMRRALARLAAGPAFDAVLVFSSTMAPYAEPFAGARRVLDLCDLDSQKWAQFAGSSAPPLSWIYGLEAQRLWRYEVEAARAFDTTLLVSEAEAATLRRACPGADVRVVPNGVDLAYYDPAAVDATGDGRTLVFCGAMDYRSNVDAVVHFHDAILPRIRARVPDAAFRIVGSNPAPAVRGLAQTPGVEVTGRVPDTRPHVLSAAVSVAPLRLGRGVPNKVLEALALALPVVATTNAVAGLDLDGFAGIAVADEAEAFAEAAADLLLAVRAGPARHPENRALLEERYSWRTHCRGIREAVLLKRA